MKREFSASSYRSLIRNCVSRTEHYTLSICLNTFARRFFFFTRRSSRSDSILRSCHPGDAESTAGSPSLTRPQLVIVVVVVVVVDVPPGFPPVSPRPAATQKARIPRCQSIALAANCAFYLSAETTRAWPIPLRRSLPVSRRGPYRSPQNDCALRAPPKPCHARSLSRSTAAARRVPVFLAAGPHFTGCSVPYSSDHSTGWNSRTPRIHSGETLPLSRARFWESQRFFLSPYEWQSLYDDDVFFLCVSFAFPKYFFF